MYLSPINYESPIKANNNINLSNNYMIGFKSKIMFFTSKEQHPLVLMDFYNRIIELLKPKNFINKWKDIITIKTGTYNTLIDRIKTQYHDIYTPQKSFKKSVEEALASGIISKKAAEDILEARKFSSLKKIPGVNEILETLPKRNVADNIYEFVIQNA